MVSIDTTGPTRYVSLIGLCPTVETMFLKGTLSFLRCLTSIKSVHLSNYVEITTVSDPGVVCLKVSQYKRSRWNENFSHLNPAVDAEAKCRVMECWRVPVRLDVSLRRLFATCRADSHLRETFVEAKRHLNHKDRLIDL